ncbi:MAG: phosphoglycolate phosphatase [Gammaproteobacteria bacterium]
MASVSPAAVLFDLDGTLIDTAPDMGGALNDMLHARDQAPLPAESLRPLVSHGSRALVQRGFAPADEAAMQTLIQEFLAVYATRVARHSALFDDMPEFLLELERLNVTWGVVTNKPEALSVTLMHELNLSDRSAVLIGGDTLSERKPHPMPLLHAAQQINIPATRCLYVGDAERDISAGRAAGMTTVAANYGYLLDGDCATRWGADYIVDSVAQLHRLVFTQLLKASA